MRYRHPLTGIIEYTNDVAYANTIGLVPYEDGPTYEGLGEVQVADLTAAASELDVDSLTKPELLELAGELGLDTKGTKPELVKRIKAHYNELAAAIVVPEQSEGEAGLGEVTTSLTRDALTETPANSGDEKPNEIPKEGDE